MNFVDIIVFAIAYIAVDSICNIIVRSFTRDTAFNDVLMHALVCKSRTLKHTFQMHPHIYTVHLIMSPQFDIFDDNVKVRDHVAVEHLAPGQMWTKTSRRFLNDTRRVVLGSLKLLNGARWCMCRSGL